jgi:hypothetical protein
MAGVWGLFHNYVKAATYHAWEAELHLRARDGDGEAGLKILRQKHGQEIYPGPKGANSVDWPLVVLGFALFALGGGLLVRTTVLPGGRFNSPAVGVLPGVTRPRREGGRADRRLQAPAGSKSPKPALHRTAAITGFNLPLAAQQEAASRYEWEGGVRR